MSDFVNPDNSPDEPMRDDSVQPFEVEPPGVLGSGFEDDLSVSQPSEPEELPRVPGVVTQGTKQSESLSRSKDERSRQRHIRIEIAAVAVLAAAALGALAGYEVSSSSPVPSSAPTTSPTSTSAGGGRASSASGAPSNAAALAAVADPALVDINVTDSYQAVEGAGTGMVLTSNGEVLTNNHVIEGATAINVVDVGNHKSYGATVVGYDLSQDIAVLRLSGASGLRTIERGDSSRVKVGDGVVVIGNAEGAGGTPSYAAGSVTALEQSIVAQDQLTGASEQLTGLIETNADVIPGDSGGAMIDDAGRVIGMTSAGSESYQFQTSSNQGYAIPINQVLAVAGQIEAGRASNTVHVGPTAFLGVLVQSPIPGEQGAEITEVVPGSAAAQSGLTAGDVITSVDGHTVTSPESLTDLLLGEAPGASVPFGYVDSSGQQHSVTVTLGKGPAQ